MTDNDPDEHDANNLEEVIDNARRNRPPRDLVAREGLTRDGVTAIADLAGSNADVVHPGQMQFDNDGMPIGMTPSRTTQDGVAKPMYRRADIEQLGLTAEELSKIHVID